MIRFIGATQVKNWNRLVGLYGGDQPATQRQFAQRVAAEIDARGVLDVLRQGVRDRGVPDRPGLFPARSYPGRRMRWRSTTRTC